MDHPGLPAPPLSLAAGDVHLRTWEPRDAEALVRACSDPEVLRWTRLPDPYTPEAARAWVEQKAPHEWSSGSGAHFGMVDAATGSLLGAAGLGDMADGAAEVGYWVAAGARGRGIATSAVRALCRWGFEELGLQRIGWQALVGNWPSRAVADRCGFRFEGTRRAVLVQRGQRVDCWSGGLLPADISPPPLPALVDGPVTLRPLRRDDVPALLAGVDAEVLRWTGLPEPFDEAAALLQVARGGPASPSVGSFAVVVSEGLVGVVSAWVDERGTAVLGWWLSAPARGRGHAARAVRLLVGWAVEQGALRVEAAVIPGNGASARLAERAGLRPEGTRRRGTWQRAKPVDAEVLAMVAGDPGWPSPTASTGPS